MKRSTLIACVAFVVSGLCACDDDDDGSDAQRHGVGAACANDAECSEADQRCLGFKGGYCGVSPCASNVDCPSGSACVAHDDGENYCFLVCSEKVDCNWYRPPAFEANCSANVTFTDGTKRKACVPPS